MSTHDTPTMSHDSTRNSTETVAGNSQGNWQTAVAKALSTTITQLTPLGGGDFAAAYRATLGHGQSVFIKTHANPPPHFFSTEAAGLQWLRDTGTVNVPQVLAFDDNPPYLALEWIPVGSSTHNTEAELGRAMARLHQTPWPSFGRTDHRTTGSLAVPNDPCDSWAEFYATRRLLPLARIAHDRHVLPANTLGRLESLASQLTQLDVPVEPPSLLHGDLWAGNRVVDTTGNSWLIDPAAHAGHREFDLAMMQLFGGFQSTCFQAYDEVYPLAPGWTDRIELHQLAPLIVHAIKFGGHYIRASTDVIKRYT